MCTECFLSPFPGATARDGGLPSGSVGSGVARQSLRKDLRVSRSRGCLALTAGPVCVSIFIHFLFSRPKSCPSCVCIRSCPRRGAERSQRRAKAGLDTRPLTLFPGKQTPSQEGSGENESLPSESGHPGPGERGPDHQPSLTHGLWASSLLPHMVLPGSGPQGPAFAGCPVGLSGERLRYRPPGALDLPSQPLPREATLTRASMTIFLTLP